VGVFTVTAGTAKASKIGVDANSLMARMTVSAVTTTKNEGADYPVTGFIGGNIFTNFFNHTTELMANDMGQLWLQTNPLPIAIAHVTITTTNTIGSHFNNGIVRPTLGVRPVVVDFHGCSKGFEDSCFHGLAPYFRPSRSQDDYYYVPDYFLSQVLSRLYAAFSKKTKI
jgi:hypothetical protein